MLLNLMTTLTPMKRPDTIQLSLIEKTREIDYSTPTPSSLIHGQFDLCH